MLIIKSFKDGRKVNSVERHTMIVYHNEEFYRSYHEVDSHTLKQLLKDYKNHKNVLFFQVANRKYLKQHYD